MMSSYAKNKLQLCSVTQPQCRHREMWGKFSQIHPVHSIVSVTKNYFSKLNNLFMVKFLLIWMSSYAKDKLQMCSVIQHQCRLRQMMGNFSQIYPVHSLLTVTKNNLSRLNNLFMVMLQLIGMSSYAKNKLQLCSDNQHQSPNVGKLFIDSPSTINLCLLKK